MDEIMKIRVDKSEDVIIGVGRQELLTALRDMTELADCCAPHSGLADARISLAEAVIAKAEGK